MMDDFLSVKENREQEKLEEVLKTPESSSSSFYFDFTLPRQRSKSSDNKAIIIVATSLSCIQIKMENDYRYEGLFCCRLSLPKAEVVNANPNSSKSVAHGLKGLSTIYLSLEAKLEITCFLLLLFFVNYFELLTS